MRSLVLTRRNIYSDVSSEIIRTDNTSQLFQTCCLMSSVLNPRHNSFRRVEPNANVQTLYSCSSPPPPPPKQFHKYDKQYRGNTPPTPHPHYTPSNFTNMTNNTEEIYVTHLNAGVRLKGSCIPPFNAMFTWKAYVAVTMGGMA